MERLCNCRYCLASRWREYWSQNVNVHLQFALMWTLLCFQGGGAWLTILACLLAVSNICLAGSAFQIKNTAESFAKCL